MDAINGIPIDAPLWKAATREDLHGIIKALQSASYHYADASGHEWGAARDLMETAAETINHLGLSYGAIRNLHKEVRPRPTLDELMDAVLRDARGA